MESLTREVESKDLGEIKNQKLYTKKWCNLIFTVKPGSEVSDLKEIKNSEIKDFLKSKGLSWANRRKVFRLDYYSSGKYTDPRVVAEVC